MFGKPFRTKSNVAIKGSDRKRLRSEVAKLYGNSLSDETIRGLVPNKEEMTVMKLYSHKGENVAVYCLKKSPVLFEHEGVLYPTIYTAWKYQNMLKLFTTQPPVFEKLHSGADLMLPGVILPKSGLPNVEKGQVVGVNVLGNHAALAIGSAVMSTRDMVEVAGMRGKGIKIMHTFGDHLWMLGDKEQPPNIPQEIEAIHEDYLDHNDLPETVNQEQEIDYFDNNPEKAGNTDQSVPAAEQQVENDRSVDVSGMNIQDEEEEAEEDCRSPTEIMDELLHQCFMTALKKRLKDAELPMLTSTFYRTHVLTCCPSDKSLDIKKTSFKKLSKYLKKVESDGIIQVKELTKGNDNIIAVCRSHPELRSFTDFTSDTSENPDESSPNTVSSYGIVTQKHYEPPEISVVHCVSSITLPLFSSLGYKKGSPMGLNEIKSLVTKYVKDHELIKPDQPRMVTLDPLLHRAMFDKGNNNVLDATWEDVFKKVISKMQACHQLKFKGMKPIIRTGGPPSIHISVQQRASNKKVTIVDNLESFLITPSHFAESMRKKAQASTSISEKPGAANKSLMQVLIQGNQVALIESLLTGSEYKIPRKYLKGLENAPKMKKKGR